MMFSFAGTAQEAGAGGRSGGSWYPCPRFIDGAFFFMHLASFTFLLNHCGSLVSTLVFLSETECPPPPSMNREQGYQLPPIYHQLLLPEQFPRRKTSRDQDFSLRSRNVVTASKTRSKVSETLIHFINTFIINRSVTF